MTISPLARTAMRNLKDNRSPRRYPRMSMAQCTALEPDIEVLIDGLLNQIHSINGAVTMACLSKDGYFSENESMDPAMSGSAERKLTERLENLAMAFDMVLGQVKTWADRARNFEQNTVVKAKQTPAAKGGPLTSSNIDVEEEAVAYVMKLLQEGGPIDKRYLRIFDHFINETCRPLLPMSHLTAFIESIADTANGRPCSIAAERAAKANRQASPEEGEHTESNEESDRPSYCPEHSSDSDHDMPDAAVAGLVHTEPVPAAPSLLPTPPLTSKGATFPQSEPDPSPPPPPQANTTLSPSPPRPAPTVKDFPTTPFYLTRLTARGYPPSTLDRPSITDGPIWTRILATARTALCVADHLAPHAESAKEHARRQQKVWRRMTNYFDERAGLIRRFRAEGGFPTDDSNTIRGRDSAVSPLTAEEREEHEAAEAVRRVEEMIRRESSGGGGGEGGDEGGGGGGGPDEEEDDTESRERYRAGTQRFEREERWRRSPSIKWADRVDDDDDHDDGDGGKLERGDENRARPRWEHKGKGKADSSSSPRSPLGFGIENTNPMLSPHLGVTSAFADVDMLVGGEPPAPATLATRSPLQVKGSCKAKMTPQGSDREPGKGRMMVGQSGDDMGQGATPGSDDEKTRNQLLGLMMRGTKRKGG